MNSHIQDLALSAVQNGYGRFEGEHVVQMTRTGHFQLPASWVECLRREDVLMAFDHRVREFVVFYVDDAPYFGDYEHDQMDFVKDFNRSAEEGQKISYDHISVYPWLFQFETFSAAGRVKINPFLVSFDVSCPSSRASIAEEPFPITIRGCGHYFTVSDHADRWPILKKGQRSVSDEWFCLTTKPYLDKAREPRGLSAFQRMLVTAPLSVLARNPKALQCVGVSDARLPELTELS